MPKKFQFMFEIGGNLSSKFKGAFSSAGSTMTKLHDNVRTMGSEMRKSESTVRGLRAEMGKLEKSLDKGEIGLYDYCKAYEKLNKEIQNQRSLQQKLGNNIGNQSQKREKLGAAMGQVGQTRDKKSQARGDLFDAAGMAVAMAAPIKAAIDMESAMSDVRKVVDGLDDKQQFNAMQNDILNLSKKIPMAADGLAQIVAAGGQSGIAKNELIGFAESAAKMGTAFDITAEDAGDMMAKWRTAFKMNQGQVVELADKINYLGNNTAASAPLISDVVRRIGPLGEVGGVASGEIAALGASMVGAGVESEVAATGIKNMILGMTAGGSATKSQAEAFAQLGLDATVMSKRMQTDAKGAIMDVLKRIQGLDKYKQASILKQLFGSESLSAIAPLLSNLGSLEKNLGLVADKSKYTGSMEKEFAAKIDTTAAKLQLAKNSVMAMGVSLGSTLLPAVQSLLDKFSSAAEKVSQFSEKHPGLTKNIALTVSGILAANIAIIAFKYAWLSLKMPFVTARLLLTTLQTNISLTGETSLVCAAKTKILAGAQRGAALAQKGWNLALVAGTKLLSAGKIVLHYTAVAAGKVITWGVTAAQWAWNAALSANPIGLVVLAIGALVAAGIWLWKNWDTLKTFLSNMWESPIVRALAFMTPIGAIIGIGTSLITNWGTVKQFFVTLWNDPSAAVDMFIDGVKSKFTAGSTWIKNTWGKVKGFFGGGDKGEKGTKGPKVAKNAKGGIYNKGAFLTTFAEESPEAAIPLDGSPRAVGLWKQAGRMLGISSQDGNTTASCTEESSQSAIPSEGKLKSVGLWKQAGQMFSRSGQGGKTTANFTEESPEAAIPLDRSPRTVGLWKQAGQMFGNKPGEGRGSGFQLGELGRLGSDVISGNITYSPTIIIQGNADQGVVNQIKQVLKDDIAELERKIKALQNQKGRVSYA